jgi:leader peptidase (prepilin peptidase)/N-methyltransferase
MFVIGAMIGSFLNVCIIRIPEKTFFSTLRSHCPHCGALIPGWHNIPILSWLILRGRSACCAKPISVQYLVVEMATALMFVVLYWHWPFVVTVKPQLTMEPAEFIRFAHGTLFCCLLLVCSVIDFRLQIIPDVISLPMIAVSPLVFVVHPELTWQSSVIGVIAGGGSLYLLAWAYFMLRGESGLGMGDVKLLAAIGGWLGWESLMPTVLVGSISGALVGLVAMTVRGNMTMRSAIPFGPFLALGAVLHLLFGSRLIEWLFTPS